MSKKYRILTGASIIKDFPTIDTFKHAFIVLQYAKPDGTFADVHDDKDAIIYRSGAASPLSCL